MSQRAAKQYWILLPIFGIIGLVSLAFRSRSPRRVIKQILSMKGLSPQMVKFWTAVSAYETAYPYTDAKPWNSPVLRDTRNLFNIIVPGSVRLQRGEGQTIYDTWGDSVYGLYDHVLKPFKYPAHLETLSQLIDYMKLKGYFQQDKATYLRNVQTWYNELYPNG